MTALPDSHQDLLDARGAAALATIGADGQPQVTAVWFIVDDGAIKVSLNETRQKLKNLRLNPQVTLFFLDPANPFRTLEVRAVAECSPDDGHVLAGKVGSKYGADLRRMDRAGESRLAVTLHPIRVNYTG
jgi:PPOX class probable F420-dependent enzyme